MGVCSICSHEKAREINRALFAGQMIRRVAKRFQLSPQALGRHRRGHLRYRHVKAQPVTLDERFRALETEMQNLMSESLCGSDVKPALAILRMRMELLTTEAKIAGRMQDGAGTVVNVNTGAGASAATQDDADQIIRDYLEIHGIPPHLLPQAQEAPIEIPAPGDEDGKPAQDIARSEHSEALDVAR